MSYDIDLADRIRGVIQGLNLQADEHIGEKKMFGGLCFTLNEKMLVGVGKGELMIRLAPSEFEEELTAGRVKPMDFTGKPLKGFAYVEPAAHASDAELLGWIDRSAAYVRQNMLVKPRPPLH